MHDERRETDSAKPASTKRLAGASVISFIYFALQSVFFLLFTPWLLKVLGGEVYGLWTVLLAIIGTAGLADLGISAAVIKFTSQFSVLDNADDKLVTLIIFNSSFLILMGTLAGVVIWLLRGWIASRILLETVSPDLLSNALTFVALGLPPLFLSQIARGILLGFIRNELAGGVALIQSFAMSIGALTIGLNGGTIVELGVWSLTVNVVIMLLSSWLAWRTVRHFHLRWYWDWTIIREMFGYSFFSWVTQIGTTLFSSGDRLLIGMLLGPTAAGAYGILTKVGQKLNQMTSPFTYILMPFASSYQAANRQTSIHQALSYGSQMSACLLVGAATTLIVWADEILGLWISPQFAASYTSIFQIIITAYAVFSIAAPAYQIALGLGLIKVPSMVVIGSGTLVLILIWMLAPVLGLAGVAYANFAYTLILSINFYVTKKLGLQPMVTIFKPIGPPLLLLLVSILLVLTVDLSLLSSLLINGIVLGLLLWVLLRNEDTSKLLQALGVTRLWESKISV